jgi:hypothetical protein
LNQDKVMGYGNGADDDFKEANGHAKDNRRK